MGLMAFIVNQGGLGSFPAAKIDDGAHVVLLLQVGEIGCRLWHGPPQNQTVHRVEVAQTGIRGLEGQPG
jgi:hypothetical protein